jgi:hypothetical protein
MQIQFTVKKKWPLEAGKDSGSFTNIDGVSAYVEPSVHQQLEEGMTFEANAQKMVSKGSGKPYYKMLGPIHLPNTVGAIIPQPNGHAAASPRPAGIVDRDVSITQQCLLKAFIGTGQFGLLDLPALEEACTASAKRLVKAAS